MRFVHINQELLRYRILRKKEAMAEHAGLLEALPADITQTFASMNRPDSGSTLDTALPCVQIA